MLIASRTLLVHDPFSCWLLLGLLRCLRVWWSHTHARRPDTCRLEAIFSEHTLEHLTPMQVLRAASAMYRHLVPGGRARIAVPDGLHVQTAYRHYIRPGSMGHKVAWTAYTLPEIFESVGFVTQLIEYWDEEGVLHERQTDDSFGIVRRTLDRDARNHGRASTSPVSITSLAFDAIKPGVVENPRPLADKKTLAFIHGMPKPHA